jgi:hypothetical protein
MILGVSCFGVSLLIQGVLVYVLHRHSRFGMFYYVRGLFGFLIDNCSFFSHPSSILYTTQNHVAQI